MTQESRYFPSQIDGATADWNPAPVDVLAMRSQGGLLRAEADKVLSVDAGFRPPPVPNGGHFLNVLASLREMGQVWQADQLIGMGLNPDGSVPHGHH